MYYNLSISVLTILCYSAHMSNYYSTNLIYAVHSSINDNVFIVILQAL